MPVPDALRQAYLAGTRSPDGLPGSRYWQIHPEYRLRGRLLPSEGAFIGSGTLRVENTSPDPWRRVVLRLDQNRFAEGNGGGVVTCGIAVRELRVNGTVVPLDSNRVSGLASTLLSIQLAQPLHSGESLTLGMRWDYEVPRDDIGLSLRQGRQDTTVYQMGQWYPRLAMYDDLAGWDQAEHDGSMEFYNPFGEFHVVLEVPTGWIVGSTGTLENPEEVLSAPIRERIASVRPGAGTVVVLEPTNTRPDSVGSNAYVEWRFTADSVADFAWATSSRYSWTATARRLPDGREVLVHSLATEEHRDALRNATNTVADAILSLSELLGVYAWHQHWLLDGPEGGMEYPGVTMSHGDGRVLHEVVHQWFPMMVGSDETRFNFIDEGLATFLPRLLGASSRTGVAREPASNTPLLLANDLRTVRLTLGYGRGSRMLSALTAEFGEEAVIEALYTFASLWRFKHPSPWDYMAVLENSLGADLDRFWLDWLFKTDPIPDDRLPNKR